MLLDLLLRRKPGDLIVKEPFDVDSFSGDIERLLSSGMDFIRSREDDGRPNGEEARVPSRREPSELLGEQTDKDFAGGRRRPSRRGEIKFESS